MAHTERMTGAEAVVKTMEMQGIEYAFGLCGHANISLLDALNDSSIEFLSVRNEGMAVYMADAYYRASHKVAAVITTLGPGLTNTVTAMADSLMDSTPLLLIAGDVPNYLIGKGALQEVSNTTLGNQWEILRPVTKRSWRVPDVADVANSIHRALNIALTGNPGPVAISVPMDFMGEVQDFEIEDPSLHRANGFRVRGDSVAIEESAKILSESERVMILAGNGVLLSEATDELIAIAEHLGAPVATTMVGQTAFPKSHELNIEIPNSIGNPAVHHAMQTADTVLVIGSRLSEFETNSWNTEVGFDPWNRQKLIQIDIDTETIGRVFPVHQGIVGDAKSVLLDLCASLTDISESKWPETSAWVSVLQGQLEDWRKMVAERELNDDTPIDPYRVVAELRKVIPENSIVHVDPGTVVRYMVGQQLTLDTPGSYYANQGFGSMGACMATVLGSKIACPDKTVIAFMGDGGFTCEMSPIITAVEHGLPVVWIVLNNQAFNSIEIYQHRHYDHRIYGTTFKDHTGGLTNTDFAAIARACGALGFRVERPENLASTLQEAISSNRPCVVEVMSDTMRYVKTYGWFEANRIFSEEAEYKRDRNVETSDLLKDPATSAR